MTVTATTTRERAVIFRPAAMLRAVLGGTKTQGRWPANPQPAPSLWPIWKRFPAQSGCPMGGPGDRLWVRETWCLPDPTDRRTICYRATNHPVTTGEPWRSSATMPRWASRLTLEVVAVRVERVQDIDHRGCVAEGWPGPDDKRTWIEAMGNGDDACIEWYADQWDALHGAGAWDRNDWVWVVEFKPVASNPASMNAAPVQDDAISKGI